MNCDSRCTRQAGVAPAGLFRAAFSTPSASMIAHDLGREFQRVLPAARATPHEAFQYTPFGWCDAPPGRPGHGCCASAYSILQARHGVPNCASPAPSKALELADILAFLDCARIQQALIDWPETRMCIRGAAALIQPALSLHCEIVPVEVVALVFLAAPTS